MKKKSISNLFDAEFIAVAFALLLLVFVLIFADVYAIHAANRPDAYMIVAFPFLLAGAIVVYLEITD